MAADTPTKASLPSKGKKRQDNSDGEAKRVVRSWLIDQLSKGKGVSALSVLELFGGEGHVYDQCYQGVKKHLAFDVRKINRPTWLQGDNRTLLKSHAKGWDLYDLDAYAAPWLVANDVCRLRENGEFGMAITCGIYRPMFAGVVTPFVRQRIGLSTLHIGKSALIARWYLEIVQRLMLDWRRHGVEVVEAKWVSSRHSRYVHYFACVLRKGPPLPMVPEAVPVQIGKPKSKLEKPVAADPVVATSVAKPKGGVKITKASSKVAGPKK